MRFLKCKSVALLAIVILCQFGSLLCKSAIKKCCKLEEYLNLEEEVCYTNFPLPLTQYFQALQITEWKLLLVKFGFGRNENISIDNLSVGRPQCFNQRETKIRIKLKAEDFNITENAGEYFLFPEISSELNDSSGHHLINNSDKFCLDWEKNEMVVELCIPKCNDGTCFRKCCQPHQRIDMSTFSCVDIQDKNQWWNPMIDFVGDTPIVSDGSSMLTQENKFNNQLIEIKDSKIQSNENFGLNEKLHVTHIGQPKCDHTFEVDLRDDEKYKRVSLLANGELLIEPVNGNKYKAAWDNFCMDGILSDSEGNSSQHKSNQIALVCFQSAEDNANSDVLHEYRGSLYVVLTGISSIFLLATSIIYVILWKDLNLPGWLQFSYINSLLITFSLLTIVQIWTTQIHHYSIQLCRVIGYTLHASFLSCFFWLTSMNIDMWCSFRNSSVMSTFGKSRGKRRYFCFAGFSISIPIAVTLTGVLIDNSPRLHKFETLKSRMWYEYELLCRTEDNDEIRMEIGTEGCALDIRNKTAQLLYFYVVVGLLLLLNLMFFFCTVLCLRERQRETKFAHRQCTASDSDLKRFRLFTRLFFIMGLLWIFELISWLSGYLELRWEVQIIFVLTDCLNALQGVAIFMMFVWKPQTWRQLRKKFGMVLNLESQTSLMGQNTNKSSLKSSTKSDGSCKVSSPH